MGRLNVHFCVRDQLNETQNDKNQDENRTDDKLI